MKIELTDMRPCLILPKKIKGFCHGIFQCSEIYKPSLMVGGRPGGVVADPVAVVEVEGGQLIRVSPFDIKFMDDKFSEYDFTEGKENA